MALTIKTASGPYTYFRTVSKEERTVVSWGYPYVSITRLNPYGALGYHGHHSNNTHLIVSGEIQIGDKRKGRDGSVFGPGDRISMSAGQCYAAQAGPNGCVFVEGHLALNPTSQIRFDGRDKA